MKDSERRNAIISAISAQKSRLAELDKERYNVLAELKSFNAELLKLDNHTPDITGSATDSPHKNISKISTLRKRLPYLEAFFAGVLTSIPAYG